MADLKTFLLHRRTLRMIAAGAFSMALAISSPPSFASQQDYQAALKAGKTRDALNIADSMARSGDRWAAGVMARYYLDGRLVPQDLTAARRLAESSAGSGSENDALLALLKIDAIGGPRDFAGAENLLTPHVSSPSTTADVHYAYAMLAYRVAPHDARRSPALLAQAKDYASRAGAAGFTPAYRLLGDIAVAPLLAGSIPDEQWEQRLAAANEGGQWYMRSALRTKSSEDFREFLRWGKMDGSAETLKTLHRLADAGGAMSQGELASRYFHGGLPIGDNLARPDMEKAARYAQMAAKQGEGKGLLVMGLLYADGYFYNKDTPKAVQYFLASAQAGELDAYKELHRMYREPGYMPKDYALARSWLERGAQAAQTTATNRQQMVDRFAYMLRSHDQGIVREQRRNAADAAAVAAAEQDSAPVRFLLAWFALGVISGLNGSHSSASSQMTEDWIKNEKETRETVQNVNDVLDGKYF